MPVVPNPFKAVPIEAADREALYGGLISAGHPTEYARRQVDELPDSEAALQMLARHRLSSTPTTDGTAVREALEQALAWAYTQGATDVHEEWKRDPDDCPRGDPDFAEAAGDYARAAVDPTDSTARIPAELLAALKGSDHAK